MKLTKISITAQNDMIMWFIEDDLFNTLYGNKYYRLIDLEESEGIDYTGLLDKEEKEGV